MFDLEKEYAVKIEWNRTGRGNLTTVVTVRARDALTAIARAVIDTEQPTGTSHRYDAIHSVKVEQEDS